MQLSVRKATISKAIFAIFCSSAVFFRLLYAAKPFSLDYQSYLVIIDALNALSFREMLGNNFIFPYVVTQGIIPIEIGFSVLVKATNLVIDSPEIIFATLAAGSVGLRVFTMESIGVPRLWSLALNLLAVTLFEANAIRLGLAISLLLFGLLCFLKSYIKVSYIAIILALSFHLQLVLFVVPFLVFYFFSSWIVRSKLRIGFVLIVFSIGAGGFTQLIPFLGNDKVGEYVSRGASGSAGLSVTSVLAILFVTLAALAIRKHDLGNKPTKFWAAILAAAAPSVVLLTFLTNIAVVGDRAWQVAFFILATFFFSDWASSFQKRITYAVLIAITAIIFTNVIIRYPLSNLIAPPFPSIETSGSL